MHVLLLVGDLAEASGGPPRVVVGLANALVDAGDTVTIFSLGTPGVPADARFNDGVDVSYFEVSGLRALARSHTMAASIRARLDEFDLLHCHGVWEGCLAVASEVFERAGKPVFVSAHGMLDRWSMAQSRHKKAVALRWLKTGRMLRYARVVFGTADEAAQAGVSRLGGSVIVPNGVDLDRLRAMIAGDPEPLLSRAGAVASGSMPILYFARIHPKKGLDLLVEAFIAVAADFPAATLLIVGIPEDMPFLTEIRGCVAKSGLGARISIVTDLAGASALPALSLARIFALPSHQEGFSIALIEGMGIGIPILATDQCHFPEIADRGAGVIVSDTASGVTHGLRTLLTANGEEQRAMGRAGRHLVERHYTWRAVAQAQRSAYAAALGSVGHRNA